MNLIRSLLSRLRQFFGNLFASKKVALANQEAIKKMEELENSIIRAEIKQLKENVSNVTKELKQLVKLEKDNQELLVYLCTTNEELLNIISEADTSVLNSSEDEEDTKDFIELQWGNKKGNVPN